MLNRDSDFKCPPDLLPSGKIDKFDIIPAMRIHVLALDGAFDTGLAIILDTLSIANDLAQLLKRFFKSFGSHCHRCTPQYTYKSGTIRASGTGSTMWPPGRGVDSRARRKNARGAAGGA